MSRSTVKSVIEYLVRSDCVKKKPDYRGNDSHTSKTDKPTLKIFSVGLSYGCLT
jgi:hypothetical protein